MSPEEIRERWARFLAGEELSPEDQKSLVDALDADPALRDSLLENLHLDGILHAMSATRRHGETFVHTLTDCLEPERDATRFIKKVESRLNENPPPSTPSSTARKTKKDTTRVFRRRPTASTSGETAWKPALIAAAAFFAILLIVTSSPGDRRPPGEVVRPPAKPDRFTSPVEPPTVAKIEKRLEELRVEETRLRTAPPTPQEKPEERQKQLVANEEERRVIEAELVKAKATPAPLPPQSHPDSTPPPSNTIVAEVPASTVVERIAGYVYLARNAGDKRRAKKDDTVPLGVDVETYPSSSARLKFSDGTWVEVGPGSSFRETAVPNSTKGRQVFLAYGTVESQISKQPVDRPMVFSTPTAEATIVGTTIRLTVTHDAKLGRTTLEVKEGKVQLTRLADRKSVDVVTGQFAVAATGVDPIPQKSFPDEVLVKFGPADVKLQPTWLLDTGEEFDATRGYGWKDAKRGPPVPGLKWRDGTGKLQDKHYGREAVRRTPQPLADELKTTDITAGWAGQAETWRMPIPNGRYLVSVCCGDVSWEQGPHHVWVEGAQVIDGKINKKGEVIESQEYLVEVRDGELNMKVGGYPGSRVSSDGSTDTCINYLQIKRVRK